MRRCKTLIVRSTDVGWNELISLIESHTAIEIVGTTSDWSDAVILTQRYAPEFVLAAPIINRRSTINLIRRIQESSPTNSRTMIFASRLDPLEAFEFRKIPVAACVLWSDVSTTNLLNLVEAVALTDVCIFSSYLMSELMHDHVHVRSSFGEIPTISVRELMILADLSEGLTYKQISMHRHLSVRTIERVISDLEAKLSMPTLFSLAVAAERAGLLSP